MRSFYVDAGREEEASLREPSSIGTLIAAPAHTALLFRCFPLQGPRFTQHRVDKHLQQRSPDSLASSDCLAASLAGKTTHPANTGSTDGILQSRSSPAVLGRHSPRGSIRCSIVILIPCPQCSQITDGLLRSAPPAIGDLCELQV